ncbi:M23 family metallopeptidase [Phormidium sp. LEGE 05292]|nr:M23 family metallopeptidase [Phormidium sp. LEGE 05292]
MFSFVPELKNKIKRIPFAFSLLPSALFILTTAILFLAAPAIAQRVQLSPANPRLGDTISVVIQDASKQEAKPTVTMNNTTYPMFPIGASTYRAFLPTTPLERAGVRKIQVQVDGQVENLSVNVGDRTFPVQRIRIVSSSSGGLEPTQHELDRVAAFRQLVTPEKYWNGPFIPPSRARRSTGYGVRRYYNGVFAKDYYHRGLDFAGAQGSPVVAPAPGKVALVGKLAEGFRLHGNIIGIDHGQGVTSVFLHLSRINVQEGDLVQSGQVIGAVGSTGAATGPHLHWGLYVNGKSIDPAPWLAQTME